MAAELLGRLQNGSHREQGGTADQSTHGRMGLGTAYKAETSRMKKVSIKKSGGKKLSHRKIPLTITNLHMEFKSNLPLHKHSVYISLHFNIITYHFAIIFLYAALKHGKTEW
jgi:hypothetical protein